MNKLVASYMAVWFFFTLLSGVMEGTGGFNATQLNGAITATSTTITVDNTTGFLSASDIIIGDEQISYTGTTATSFTGCTRGVNDTVARGHLDNALVYNLDAAVQNRGVAFNVVGTSDDIGGLAVAAQTVDYFVKSLPNLIAWDFSFLTGELIVVRWLMIAIGGGFILYIAFNAISAAFGIIRR